MTSATNPQAKKREKERACDGCRRRKTKCDGPRMQQNICTNCIQTCKACTYVEASKPRGPPKAYVTGLEDRLEAFETLLQRLCPDTDFSEQLGPPVIRGSWKHLEPVITSTSGTAPTLIPFQSQLKDVPVTSNPLPHTTHLTFLRSKKAGINTEAIPTSCAGSHYLSDEDLTTDTSSSDTEEMLVTSSHGQMKISLLANETDDMPDENAVRFHNKSCTASLLEATWKFKHMHIRETLNLDPSASKSSTLVQSRRPQFWRTPEWELLYQSKSNDSSALLPNFLLCFPPRDLADTLINLYFEKSNPVCPLLHRPTFDRQWRDGLYHHNTWFTCVCLCLFAVASRWCDDERVLPEGSRRENGEFDWRKAGRQYLEAGVEIHRVRKNITQPASLFEVQTFTLMGMYLRGTNAFPVAWLVVSVGIRRAQDVGAHLKRIYRTDPNADDELWKRAFWHLVVFDRIGSVSLGRAASTMAEDFDLCLPLEVDDEYWEGRQDAEKAFEQPPNIPSRIAAFNYLIKLTQIMAFTLRTMYAVDKSKIFCGVTPVGKETLVRQLSSAMEKWLETVPKHLKWRDDMNNPELSLQSATLFTAYYLTLMLIHRPLITTSPPSQSTMPRKPCSSELSPHMLSEADPALLICTDAALSCARIVEVQLRDGLDKFYMPSVIHVAHVCAGLLSYRIWDLKVQEKAQRSEFSQDVKPPIAQRIEDYMADARIFVRALEQAKPRWDNVDSMLEELNASLPGENQTPLSNHASHLGPISDGHSSPSTHASYPTDIQSRQLPTARQFKHNSYFPYFQSLLDTEHFARHQDLPTHLPNAHDNSDANYNQFHPVTISSRPRSLSATELAPHISDEYPSSYTTKALRQTSFSNLHAMESHGGQKYPSSSTPAESFSIGGSTVKYHDINILFDEGYRPSIHPHNLHQIYTIPKPPSNIYDRRGYNRLREGKCLPARAMGLDRSATHQGWSATAVTPPDLPYDGQQDYSHSQIHLPYF